MPEMTMEQMISARYVLFNGEEDKLTYPLRLDVFKSRVELCCTDFFAWIKKEYPSVEHVSPMDPRVRSGRIKKECIIIHDEFDIIKFLLLYGD